MLECLYGHCFRLCFDFAPYRVSTHSPARSQSQGSNLSSNLSRQSTQEYVESSVDIYEPEQPLPAPHLSPARSRWIHAIQRVCAELSEVSGILLL
jgi:hypothetical protein